MVRKKSNYGNETRAIDSFEASLNVSMRLNSLSPTLYAITHYV
jgi:hypothetical protein